MKKDLSHSVHDQERDHRADEEDVMTRRREEKTWKACWWKLHQEAQKHEEEDLS